MYELVLHWIKTDRSSNMSNYLYNPLAFRLIPFEFKKPANWVNTKYFTLPTIQTKWVPSQNKKINKIAFTNIHYLFYDL